MPEDARPVRWISQAVVTLPQHIDSSNARHVREQLLRVVSSGAAVLIADLAATVTCDYTGAEAVAHVYQRAVASGTDLRLVVHAESVRHAFGVNRLHRLIPMHFTLDAALAAAREASELPDLSRRRLPARRQTADPPDCTGELLDRAVNDIVSAAMNLQDAIDLPRDTIAARITDPLRRLDDAVREIRDHVPGVRSLPTAAAENLAFPCLLDSAHRFHAAAVDAAALLERRPGLAGEPGAIDYPADIKRWRIIADQAEEMAKHWEQRS